jgi:hypothetical protein
MISLEVRSLTIKIMRQLQEIGAREAVEIMFQTILAIKTNSRLFSVGFGLWLLPRCASMSGEINRWWVTTLIFGRSTDARHIYFLKCAQYIRRVTFLIRKWSHVGGHRCANGDIGLNKFYLDFSIKFSTHELRHR